MISLFMCGNLLENFFIGARMSIIEKLLIVVGVWILVFIIYQKLK